MTSRRPLFSLLPRSSRRACMKRWHSGERRHLATLLPIWSSCRSDGGPAGINGACRLARSIAIRVRATSKLCAPFIGIVLAERSVLVGWTAVVATRTTERVGSGCSICAVLVLWRPARYPAVRSRRQPCPRRAMRLTRRWPGFRSVAGYAASSPSTAAKASGIAAARATTAATSVPAE